MNYIKVYMNYIKVYMTYLKVYINHRPNHIIRFSIRLTLDRFA